MGEIQFRDIFRKVHAPHSDCLADEWLTHPCSIDGVVVDRPIIWSRRNGPWQHSDFLWVGAAPGNAGGKGSGNMGAHGTRIPFGGDVAGANLEVLFGSIGIDRNHTFITAALNHLPAAGGGEPTFAELKAPVGAYESNLHLLRDTVRAVQPRMIVALGNIGLRSLIASTTLDDEGVRLPSLETLKKAGFVRNCTIEWSDLPPILWLTHPSAQNMSPYARKETLFHTRMLDARNALQSAVKNVFGWKVPSTRAPQPHTGIYALKEWKELIAPRHELLDRLWREKAV